MVMKAEDRNTVVVQVGTEKDEEVVIVHHVGEALIDVREAQIDIGGVEVGREKEAGNGMAGINEVVVRKGIMTVTKERKAVETKIVVKNLEEIGSVIA